MTKLDATLRERLKRVGFTHENEMRLYGQEFILQSDPIIMGDNLIFVDAIEKKSGQLKRVRIPLTIVRMAMEEYRAA
ncbi:MAG TPA: hypothetical protein VEI26_17550 [Terriglobales bacterium]|nr:hypothetical protein [Terriglobales bacterium]